MAQKTASMKRKGGMSHSGNRERELVASEKADFMRSMVGWVVVEMEMEMVELISNLNLEIDDPGCQADPTGGSLGFDSLPTRYVCMYTSAIDLLATARGREKCLPGLSCLG